jgi:hypothetical protein
MRPMRPEIAGAIARGNLHAASKFVAIGKPIALVLTLPSACSHRLAMGFLSAFVRRRRACLVDTGQSLATASLGARLRRQQHLPDVFAVLNRMMGRGGFVEWEDPSDLGLDRALSRRLIS